MLDEIKEILKNIVNTLNNKFDQLINTVSSLDKKIEDRFSNIEAKIEKLSEKKEETTPPITYRELQTRFNNGENVQSILNDKKLKNDDLKKICKEGNISIKAKAIKSVMITSILEALEKEKPINIAEDEAKRLKQQFDELAQRWSNNEKEVENELEKYSEDELKTMYEVNHIEVKSNEALTKTNILQAIFLAFRERRSYLKGL
ncbi:MAG: hypothetical protein L3V56_14925 [Candidatus Magnetoovum sp. WYHC-5]|nr:hypothetical protein [Candidatus Magnetoovum sp. WYHC-5]